MLFYTAQFSPDVYIIFYIAYFKCIANPYFWLSNIKGTTNNVFC